MSASCSDQLRKPLRWNPSVTSADIDKKADYLIRIDDFDIDITAYTRFSEGALNVIVSGLRLYHLLKQKKQPVIQFEDSKYKNSMKNVCFEDVTSKTAFFKKLRCSITLPPCITDLINDILVRPRGDRFKKRFVFNSYMVNVVTCTKCNKRCVFRAISLLYDNDKKCIDELRGLLKKEKFYLPYNCKKMACENMCPSTSGCFGSNPINNF
jgi:hypothetical protein